jgi:hypothetical protein
MHVHQQHGYIAGRRGRLVVAYEFRIAVAELADVAVSPTAERPGGEACARMVRSDCNLGDACSDVHITRRSGRLVVANHLPVHVAEASVGATPAANVAVREPCAGILTGRDLSNRRADVHVADRPRRLVVTDIVGVTVTETAVCPVAPTTNVAGLEQRASLISTDAHLHGSTSNGNVAG